MITVTLTKADGKIIRVRAIGHSGAAARGSDIICAAVSAVVQTAYLALKDIGEKTDYVRDEKKGLFEFTVGDGNRAKSDVILRAMVVGLQDLAEGYPQNIKLEEQ